MKNFSLKSLLPHAIAIVVFIVVACIYCKPTFEGKVLQQHDITQWKAMAQNLNEFKQKHGHFPLWTNGMFSGMPAYLIAMEGDNPVSIGYLANIMTLNLPEPVNFFFLACLCFYILALVLRVNPYIGIIGALGYAYATYNPIIIAAGHATKMMAIAYLPFFIAGIILIYERKYILGLAISAFATSCFISANHTQITYYGLIIAVFMSVGYGIYWILNKEFSHMIKAFGCVLVSALLGVGVNSVTLFTTYEYSKETIRGGSALAEEAKKDKDTKVNATKTGLGKDYALSYSMYQSEPFVMMFPRMFGGGSGTPEVAEDKSKAVEALQNMNPQLAQQLGNYRSYYWGGIGGTSGPPYVGAIICFLALLGFVVLQAKHKWWVLACAALAIIMSWGSYFEGFSMFLLNNLPLYNKFRAPSMIIVIPTFLFCFLAVQTLQYFFEQDNVEELWKKYKKGIIVTACVFVVALWAYISLDYAGEADKALIKQIADITDAQQKAALEEPVRAFVKALKEDRKALFLGDIFRSLAFIAFAAIALWAIVKRKLNKWAAIAVIGLLAFIDVISVDAKYLGADQYQEKNENEAEFAKTKVDEDILKDPGYYRVFNLTKGAHSAFNFGALDACYHKSIGGYHPAKLSIYQDLIEKQLYNFPNCMPVINMLNTKYIIYQNNQNGSPTVQLNNEALGACWFVKGIDFKNGPSNIMSALTNFNTKDSALVDAVDAGLVNKNIQFDSTAFIKLIKNENDIVEYESSSNGNQFAVFSEVYYNKGWKAYIDDKESAIVRTNYVLRGLNVPAGKHKIKFEFKPQSFYGSMKFSIIASIIIWLLLLFAGWQFFKQSSKVETKA